MIEFQKAIKNLLQEELNKNTQGLNFEVSLYNVKTNSLLENELPVGDTYATQQKRFIPFLIEDISGDYADLQNLTALEATINTSFLIPTDDTDFNNMVIDEGFEKVSRSLDELRKRLLANTLTLGSEKYLLPKNFRLDFSEMFYSLNLILNFPDRSSGDILKTTNSSDLTVSKDKDNIIISIPDEDLSTSIPYETDREYSITIENSVGDFLEAEDGTELEDGDLIIFFDKERITGKPNYYIKPTDKYPMNNLLSFGGVQMYAKQLSFRFGPLITNFLTLENRNSNYQTPEDQAYSLQSGEVKTFGSVGNITFGFSVPNPTTNQFTFGNGLNYQQFEMNMDVFVTDNVFVGNIIEYYLDDIRIYPIFRDESYASETDGSQIVGQQVTRHTAIQTAVGREYSVFYKVDEKLNQLLEKITSETPNPNEVHKLKVKYPFVEREHDVIITQGALGISNNQPISITFKLDLASNILI